MLYRADDWIYQCYVQETMKTNKDYYLDNGKIVMTADYHIKRGYCCGSGCRHCPYDPKHIRGNTFRNKI